MQMTEAQLERAQGDIIAKAKEYQETRKRDILDNIQEIVNAIGKEFVLNFGKQRIHFVPKSLSLGADMDQKIRSGGTKKTKAGIILPD